MKQLKIAIALLVVVVCFLIGCEKPLEVNARVFDTDGHGIAGAVVYCEAWQYNDGAYDFTWGVADSTGTVRSVDARPMTLRWRSGAKLGIAVLAAGKRTWAANDYTNVIKPQDFEVVLVDTAGAIMPWEPKLASLSFPFEEHPRLAERLKSSKNLILVQHFADAYSVLQVGTINASADEMNKLSFLARIQTEIAGK